MSTFHDECSRGRASFNVGCAVIAPGRAHLLVHGLAALAGGERLFLALADVKQCFAMTAEQLPRPPSKKPHKPKRKAKAKAKSKNTQTKSKAAGKGRSKAGKRPIRDHDDCSDDDKEVAGDAMDTYLQDNNLCDEGEYQTDSSAASEDRTALQPPKSSRRALARQLQRRLKMCTEQQ